MKKLLLLPIAVTALFIASCQKENPTPNQPTNEITTIANRVFKHKKEIKVYDKTEEHYLTVTLQSDNEDEVNNASEYYNNAELVLVYQNSKPTNLAKNHNKSESNSVKNPRYNDSDIDNPNVLYTNFHIDDKNKAGSVGYRIIPQQNSRTLYHLYFTNSKYFSADAQYFYITAYTQTVFVDDYIYDGGTNQYYLINSDFVYQGSPKYFSGPTGFRLLYIRATIILHPTHVAVDVTY